MTEQNEYWYEIKISRFSAGGFVVVAYPYPTEFPSNQPSVQRAFSTWREVLAWLDAMTETETK